MIRDRCTMYNATVDWREQYAVTGLREEVGENVPLPPDRVKEIRERFRQWRACLVFTCEFQQIVHDGKIGACDQLPVSVSGTDPSVSARQGATTTNFSFSARDACKFQIRFNAEMVRGTCENRTSLANYCRDEHLLADLHASANTIIMPRSVGPVYERLILQHPSKGRIIIPNDAHAAALRNVTMTCIDETAASKTVLQLPATPEGDYHSLTLATCNTQCANALAPGVYECSLLLSLDDARMIPVTVE